MSDRMDIDKEKTIDTSYGRENEGYRNYAYSDQLPPENPMGNPPSPEGKENAYEKSADERLSWDYMPPDKESPPANPVLLLGAIGVIAACLILAIGILLGRLTSGRPGKAEKQTQASRTENGSASTAPTTEKTAATTADTGTEQTTVPATAQTTADPDSLTLSDNLADYTFSIDGVVYQIPCDYSLMVLRGWSISQYSDKKETDMVGGEDSVYFTMVKNESKMTVEAYNPGRTACTVKECKIGGINVTGYNTDSFVMAKNIKLDSSVEEVKKAFGNPENSNDYDDYTHLRYPTNPDNYRESVSFSLYKRADKKKYSSISLRRVILSQAGSGSSDSTDSSDTPSVSDEVPTYLSEYRPPQAMDSTGKKAIFKLDGKLYQLPCPLNQFLDDGWTVKKTDKASINGLGEESSAILIEKEGIDAHLTMANFMKYPIKSENCAVSGISFFFYNTSYTEPIPSGRLECPCGVKPEMTMAQLKNATTLSDWKQYENDKKDYNSLTSMYYDQDKQVTMYFSWMDFESGTQSRSIQISSKAWAY